MPACDPLAAALGNASLLGVGYLLLRRRGLAFVAVIITVTLGVVLAVKIRETWFECVVLVWWVAVTVHGWYLARRELRRPMSTAAIPAALGAAPYHVPKTSAVRQRLIAAVVTVPVLLAVDTLRLEAESIERKAVEAHRDGDCERALSILDELWAGHRVTNAPLTARTEAGAEACRLLLQARQQQWHDRLLAARTLQRYAAHPAALWKGAHDARADLLLAQAAVELGAAVSGEMKINALRAGSARLEDILKEFPDREREAAKLVDQLIGRLRTTNACDTRKVAGWLHEQPPPGKVLDRARNAASEMLPAALVKCGDILTLDKRWEEARAVYKELIDRYPSHNLVATAKRGIRKADLAIQLARVKELLETGEYIDEPEYCSKPAPYKGAPRYRGKGPHRTLLFGDREHRKALPSSWRARGATDAVLVICVDSTYGDKVATCRYLTTSKYYPSGIVNVTFHKQKYRIRVYELRTGKLVAKTTRQIGRGGCSRYVYYTYYEEDIPPTKEYVATTGWEIRAMYRPFINP